MEESIFMDRVRGVFAILDSGIYNLITIFFDTIETLVNTPILDGNAMNSLSTKIYGLLSIFMIFKISFSLINFLINPDLVSDNGKGGGKLLKNIIITFALIITVPFAFDLLYRAQKVIISDGIIEKYILDGDLDTAGYSLKMSDEHCDFEATTNKTGDYIGLMAFKPFFQVSEASLNDEPSDFNGKKGIKIPYCMADTGERENKASVRNILYGNIVYSAPHGFSWQHYYVVDYSIFLSTAIGIVIALLLLSFCFDVATRSIKLAFLELIAPIPIISYIDPDSSKNGMFKKWMKEVFNTWLSLFMRLASLYFAVYIINLIATIDISENSLWIKILIIIGALIFAKQLPKILEDILGIKGMGSFTLNPLKKVSNEALGGKLITGAAVAGAGLAVSGVSQMASNLYAFGRDRNNLKKAIDNETDEEKKKKLQLKYDSMGAGRAFQTATGGLIGGARRGAVSGFKSGTNAKANVFGNLKNDLKSGNTARNNRTSIRNFNRELERQRREGTITNEEYNEQVYDWWTRNVTENADRTAGVKNEYGGYGYYDKKISKLTEKIENNDQQEMAIRNASAAYAANNNLNYNQSLDDYNKFIESGKKIENMSEDNDEEKVLKALYKNFAALDELDKQTKGLKSERKAFQEMLDARQNLKDKK